jgi:UDP-N-acetylmuramate--alanine ligase
LKRRRDVRAAFKKCNKKIVNINNLKKIHFVGIGGIGVSAIAKLMIWQEKKVSGSDCQESEITNELKKMGAEIFIGHKQENLNEDIDLAICTLAVPENNPEIIKAKKFGIPIFTYPQALGFLTKEKFGIAVCGTHGKSTASSMLALILKKSGLDPTIVIGSKVADFNGNAVVGKSKYFVFEACEYKRAFLNYYPKIIILNNVELDHTDYYKNLEDYKSAFEEFIKHLPKDGMLIINEKVKIQNSKVKILSFGSDKKNDLVVSDIQLKDGETRFKVIFQEKNLGEFVLKVPGIFNIYNALGAIAAALLLEIKPEIIKKTLADFQGIWRRFESVGEINGAKIISDYAHHPTEVKAMIEGAEKFYPDKRIIAVFQPHRRNRTKKLFNDFIKSFDRADMVILSEIFDVAGREEKKDSDVSSLDLVKEIKKRSKEKTVLFAKNLKETKKLILKNARKNDIILVMGAGDIYKITNYDKH